MGEENQAHKATLLGIFKGRFEEYEEGWLVTYAYLRASEWLGLPLFLAQPIAPILLIFFPALFVILGVVLLSWAWSFVRYRIAGVQLFIVWPSKFSEVVSVAVSVALFTEAALPLRAYRTEYRAPKCSPLNLIRLTDAIQWLVHLKWPISIAAGLYLVIEGRKGQATLAVCWPLVSLLLMRVCRTSGLIGSVQKSFLLALGFLPVTGDPADCLIENFHRRGCEHLVSDRCYLCRKPCEYPIRTATRVPTCPACLQVLIRPILDDPEMKNLNYEELKSSFEIALQPWLSHELPDLLTELSAMRKRDPGEGLFSKFSLEAPRFRLGGLIGKPLEEAWRVTCEREGPDSLSVWGSYQLGQSIKGTDKLTELSPAEYGAFRVRNPALFPDERIFKGRPTFFKGALWTVIVGSTSDKIYKIALQRVAENQASADRLFQLAKQYLGGLVGKEPERFRSPERYIWDKQERNIVLENCNAFGKPLVTLYVTAVPATINEREKRQHH
jgi:hypothetical protein